MYRSGWLFTEIFAHFSVLELDSQWRVAYTPSLLLEPFEFSVEYTLRLQRLQTSSLPLIERNPVRI